MDSDDNQLIAERREKLTAWRARSEALGQSAFPNHFKPTHHAADLQHRHAQEEHASLDAKKITVAVAGRLMLKRVMGKASFGTLQDTSGRIQLFVTRDALGEEAYGDFKHSDLGDIFGAQGHLFRTKTGELSVQVIASCAC